jgi:hypothetical protein
MTKGSFLEETRDFSLLRNVQTGSGVHPASYAMVTLCPFFRVKQPEAWS